MKVRLSYLFAAFFFLIGIGLFILTNSGILNIGQSYTRNLAVQSEQQVSTVAFVHANVIPMTEERLLLDQTVIVRDGLIETVAASESLTVPDNSQVIDASGRYLMPGLVDMHVHIEDENDLLLYVANGVTTVRNLWGNTDKKLALGMPDQLALRDQINRGELFGPTIYTSGPIMEGFPANHPLMSVYPTPEEAAESVAWQVQQGYDFIKVYDHLNEASYQAIIETARQYDIPVVGHVPNAVGLDSVLASGQSTIEHLFGYINPDTAQYVIPEDQLSEYALRTREAGVWNCPTIGLYQNTVPNSEISKLQQQDGVQYLSPLMRNLMGFFITQLGNSVTYDRERYPARIDEIYTRMTRELHDAGAKVILGTDASNSYLVPGFSLLNELDYLVKAGFSPYEALESGTRNAAEALGKLDTFGTIEPGKRADFILVELNPLEDVSNTRLQAGVMLRGRWMTKSELNGKLSELSASYEPRLLERLWPLVFVLIGSIIVLHQYRR